MENMLLETDMRTDLRNFMQVVHELARNYPYAWVDIRQLMYSNKITLSLDEINKGLDYYAKKGNYFNYFKSKQIDDLKDFTDLDYLKNLEFISVKSLMNNIRYRSYLLWNYEPKDIEHTKKMEIIRIFSDILSNLKGVSENNILKKELKNQYLDKNVPKLDNKSILNYRELDNIIYNKNQTIVKEYLNYKDKVNNSILFHKNLR